MADYGLGHGGSMVLTSLTLPISPAINGPNAFYQAGIATVSAAWQRVGFGASGVGMRTIEIKNTGANPIGYSLDGVTPHGIVMNGTTRLIQFVDARCVYLNDDGALHSTVTVSAWAW